jgi:4-hydroxybenzoyl-CoA thioesterase
MIYTTPKLIRFQHCDPAGIVFYPQYFHLLHEVQEDFLAHIGFPEHELIHAGVGLPIVDLKTRFVGMCRHGDRIDIALRLSRIGQASIGMHYEITGPSSQRGGTPANKLVADAVVVYMHLADGKALPIPQALRHALVPYCNQPEVVDAAENSTA